MKTVSSRALCSAAELVNSYGVDPEALALGAGLYVEALTDPDMLVSAAAVLAFYDAAATACDDPCFGIELARCQGLEILGSVWLMARHALTVGEAVQSIEEALQLHSNAIVLRSEPEADGRVYAFDTVTGQETGEAQVVDLGFALLARELRAHAGSAWTPDYVQFRHAAPPSLKRHQQEFGDNLKFNQDRNAMRVNGATLALPMQQSDRSHAVLKNELRLRQITASAGFASRVEIIIRNLITAEKFDSEVVAAALGISVRTLQHKLAECSTRYQDILDDVRLSLARKYLRHSELSIAEIAELLHFSETSAFSRFFSRQMQMSPRAYQKQPAATLTSLQ